MKYIPKYILNLIALVIWYCYQTLNLIVQTILKGLSVLILTVWYFRWDPKWLKRFKKYHTSAIIVVLEFRTLKDFYNGTSETVVMFE